MDRGAWWVAVHGIAQSQTWLSGFTFTFHLHALEEEMATHSSVLAGRIPGTGEPGGLPSMGLHRVRHDWSDLAAAAAETASECSNRGMKEQTCYVHTAEHYSVIKGNEVWPFAGAHPYGLEGHCAQRHNSDKEWYTLYGVTHMQNLKNTTK